MKQGEKINLSERTFFNSQLSSDQYRNWVPRLIQPGHWLFKSYMGDAIFKCCKGLNC